MLQVIASPLELTPAGAAALAASAFGPFEVHTCAGRDEVLTRLAESGCDALILHDGETALDIAAEAGRDVAILVVATAELDAAGVLAWLRRGAQDVLRTEELEAATLPQRLRAAIERKRLEQDARTAYATDLDTGLPHQQQLIEHMSQLLALREREPAPMAVLALRIEGLATTEARLGRDTANVLRRKVGVRLRAGVRASDVVASLGDDSFAVLLGSILTPADAARVGAKLLKSLLDPFRVSGHEVAVATAIGIGQYPEDGTQPDALLRRAVGLAAAAQAQGRAGFSNFAEAGGGTAANDE
ncbi:MAG: GGDEF domain-containing protein [Solirubrobacteraceae bacterium]|nr:GGDEF domain-containing protein [Solirubrobacteraceae bacterium]